MANPVKIGYYDPFGIYPLIKDELNKISPILSLHIRFHPSQPLKTIHDLSLEFTEEIPKKSESSTLENYNVYTRLMLIKIESLDKYRSQVRPLIKEWLKNLVFNEKVNGSSPSWMILLYVPSDAKDKQSTIIKMSHYDKLLKDFSNEGGKELAALFAESTSPTASVGAQNSESTGYCFKFKQNEFELNEFLVQIKNLLGFTFNQKYHLNLDLITTSGDHENNSLTKYVATYNLAELFYDMKLFNDCINFFNRLSEQLNTLVENNPNLFIYKVDLPAKVFSNKFDFKKFYNNKCQHMHDVNSFTNVNLFELKCFIFFRQASTLEMLVNKNLNNSISLAELQISKLLRNLVLFLNDLLQVFQNEQALIKFEYSIIEYFLNLDIVNKLIEQATKLYEAEPANNNNSYQLKRLFESRGELKLLQRSSLIKLARENSIEIKGLDQVFEDVSLNEEEGPKQSKDSTEKVKLDLKHPKLLQAIQSKDSFVDEFTKLTEGILEDFMGCDRSKTIDVLSIDLAILNYEKGDYSECLEILHDSYDFFIQNGWNYLGGILLEIYYGCMEKTQSTNFEEILSTCLKLLSCLVANHTDINSFRLINNKLQIKKLFDKIEVYANKLDPTKKFERSLNQFFKTDILPYISADESTSRDKYLIRLKLKNPFSLGFVFKHVELIMVDEEGSEIVFHAENVEILDKIDNTIQLSTNNFILGSFSPYRLTIQFYNSLFLVLDYGEKELQMNHASFLSDTVIEHNSNNNDVFVYDGLTPMSVFKPRHEKTLLAYQNINKLTAQFCCANDLKLGSTEVVLKIKNGSNPIHDVRIKLFSTTEGLTVVDPDLKVSKLDSHESQTFLIPYNFVRSVNKIINMRAKIEYKVDNEEQYSFQVSYNIDTALTISVTVQDIFKRDFIYSKFQVGTSNPKYPIRIINNDLTTESNYEIIKPSKFPSYDIIAFGEQPSNFFYKIKPKSNKVYLNDTLSLKVDYTNLQEECEEYVSQEIIHQLERIKLVKYWYLIKDVIVSKLTFDLNGFAVYKTIRFLNGLELNLLAERIILQYVESSVDQKNLVKLMLNLLVNHNFETPIDSYEYNNVLHLHISVPVPVLKYLQIVEYEYDKKQYTVGEPINVNLKINTVTRWCPKERDHKFDDSGNESQPLAVSSPQRNKRKNGDNNSDNSILITNRDQFQLVIQQDDNWLMSGFKRFTFNGGQETTKQLTLIPLNVGKIPLPQVSIKELTDGVNLSIDDEEDDDSDDIDIEFINGLETILIIPEVNSITFSF